MQQKINTAPRQRETIDRNSFEPAYLQLANILRRQIARGQYRPGDQLPSEAQLCQMYGISPMTVRRSINLLSDMGVVSTVKGRGTYVKGLELSTANFDLQRLEALFDTDIDGRIQLLDVRIVSADERTARKLELQVGDTVIYIRRLFTTDKPVFYHRAYLIYDPRRPIVEAEMDVTSLQGLLTCGTNTLLKRGEVKIKTALVNSEEAGLLDVPEPSAAFYLEHIFYDFEDRPISWGWFIMPSERLHFTTQIGFTDE